MNTDHSPPAAPVPAWLAAQTGRLAKSARVRAYAEAENADLTRQAYEQYAERIAEARAILDRALIHIANVRHMRTAP